MDPSTAERLACRLLDRHCPSGGVEGLSEVMRAGGRLEGRRAPLRAFSWRVEVEAWFDELAARAPTEEIPLAVLWAGAVKVEDLMSGDSDFEDLSPGCASRQTSKKNSRGG